MTLGPGTVRLSDTSIANAVVDNTAYAYWLQCQINFVDGVYSTEQGIYGADVIYTIDPAKG